MNDPSLIAEVKPLCLGSSLSGLIPEKRLQLASKQPRIPWLDRHPNHGMFDPRGVSDDFRREQARGRQP